MPDAPTVRYRSRPPLPALRREVECVWMAWDPRPRVARPVDHVVPDACPELIVHLADPFSRRVGSRWRRQPRAFLAGTLSRPWLLRGGRRLRTLGIRFRPGGVTWRIPVHMSRATDREVPLPPLVGAKAAAALLRSLAGARTWRRATETAEQWLLERPVVTRGEPVTARATEAILTSRGRRRIADVASTLGIHPRRLERAFARDLGIRPKLFARIIRLNAALAALKAGERTRAVDWALDAGYFDQAHLSRDFRAVAGRRARTSREADGELARHFTDPRRLSSLLGGE